MEEGIEGGREADDLHSMSEAGLRFQRGGHQRLELLHWVERHGRGKRERLQTRPVGETLSRSARCHTCDIAKQE